MNELTILSTDSHLKDEEPVYACEFINHRANWVTVSEFGNRVLFELAPGASFVTEAWDPGTSYAPFRKIEFKEGDKVECKRNPDWTLPTNPRAKYPIELLNIDGSGVEGYYVNGPSEPAVHVYKGVPRFVAIGLSSPYIRYKKIEWRTIKDKAPDPQNPNFMIETTRLEQAKEPRSKAELDEIESEIKREAREKVEREIEKAMKK